VKVTEQQVKAILYDNSNWSAWVSPMQDLLGSYNVNSADRIAMFFAQCGHESLNFQVLEENLNYSAKALGTIWKKYFGEGTGRDPLDYHRQPEKIANVVYANRMGNGDEASGDGWRFRGKGAIQVTGRENTTNFANAIGRSVEGANDYLLTTTGALESALWYWDKANLNEAADARDIRLATKRINGGYHGLDDRTNRYMRAQLILSGKDIVPPLKGIIKLGSTGEEVRKVQFAIGVEPDGVFGRLTEAAVIAWQGNNGLTPDGIVGPKTFKAMIG
jgi:putative chitinase